jgi:hypothetical protein
LNRQRVCKFVLFGHWSKAKSVVKSGQVIVEPVETLAVVLFFGQRFGWRKAAQQSVQPTGGIRPDLQAFFWLQVFPALEANLVPPTSG